MVGLISDWLYEFEVIYGAHERRLAPFLISGGGIGGLVTAYALAQKGFPVRLFEQSPEFREVGAGIQLGPNIFRALETDRP